MGVEFLGVLGEINSKKRNYANHNCLLVDKRIMLDYGEKKFLKCNPELILFTHFHPDHAFFIRKKCNEISDIVVHGPGRTNQVRESKIIISRTNWAGYSITPIPTLHSLHFRSLGYLIEKGLPNL